ncbi:Gfo/Idh/MocA family oxidoreductase [Luteolibacter yonseiensis]|uniref:Gfo/Idh/MocA family oxidoreductase n=1 Tax=Luteolibacter yonseiensis TaxID=1144680 RepID=A0A934R6Z6_9BACT|nr:Gfo/Idh/MocA family oxidoreductase [Luteolibacter yonseiensis]MBK1818172.1 Gfo/Idh/MocA family oxidoreductase [Luteolibacter yonseiensis]
MNPFSRRHFIQLGAAAAVSPFFIARAQEASQKKLGVALLGLGDYSTNQLGPALKQTKNARLAGIVTGSPEKIPKWQKEYEIPDGNIYNYQNFDTIADNKDIDIVYVVTPTALHPEFTIRAAQAGKHVICEKPMAPTTADCMRMIEAVKKAGKTLQIGYRLHWDPNHMRLMDAMKKKEFGDWKSISTANGSVMKSFTGLNAWRIGKDLGIAGALYDMGVYCVQGSLYTAGMNPVSVTAKHFTDRPEIFKEVPETYEWVLEFADGRKAEGTSSYGRQGNFLRAVVEKGVVEIAPGYNYGGGPKGRTPDGEMNFGPVNQQALQIDGQVASILAGTPSLVPGEMGARDIQVINGIIEAAETGKAFTFGKFPY